MQKNDLRRHMYHRDFLKYMFIYTSLLHLAVPSRGAMCAALRCLANGEQKELQDFVIGNDAKKC